MKSIHEVYKPFLIELDISQVSSYDRNSQNFYNKSFNKTLSKIQKDEFLDRAEKDLDEASALIDTLIASI